MSNGVKHSAHLPVATFTDGDDEHAVPIAAALVREQHVGRQRAASVERDASAKAIERLVIGHSGDVRFVSARDLMARMRQPRREISIVGEQQKPLRIVVQSSDRIHVFAYAMKQVDNGPPTLRIRSRRHVASRFVEEDVAEPFGLI
jgi:hypothetical protein